MSVLFDANVTRYASKVQRHCGASLRIDHLGRWSSARLDGTMFRRTVPCEVVQITGTSRFALVDSAVHHARIAKLAQEFAQQLACTAADDIRIFADPEKKGVEGLLQRLRLAAAWTPDAYSEESARFHDAYPEAIEILPPDRYGDLVVLPALGCPNSTCSFCAFYRQRQFRILSGEDFTRHLDAVCQLFGEAALGRQGLFLGSASALSLSQRILLSRLGQIQARFARTQRGVGAFWDPDHSPKRTESEWRELKDAGLTSAYLGLETGLSELRASLGKSADVSRLLRKTEQARAAGVQIGVMVLAGISGLGQFAAHCEATANAVQAMALRASDLVFVSPILGARPQAQLDSEAKRLHAAISERTSAKVAPYAAERFHYYA